MDQNLVVRSRRSESKREKEADNTCWSFNGPEPHGSESKREKEADIPWFTWKAKSPVLGLTLLHVGSSAFRVGEGSMCLLERVLKARARK